VKTKKRKWVILLIIFLGTIIMVTVILLFHPTFKSTKRILNETLKLTPIGMHIDDVVMLVENQMIIKDMEEMHPPIIYCDSGYINPSGEVLGWPDTVRPGNRSIAGHKSVEVAYKGSSADMYFSIFWGFNEDGYLIDVLVCKAFDMIQAGEARKTAK
jgi:hypothetical protein